MNPFTRMLQRLGLMRVRSPRPERVPPAGPDDGDAAAGGVLARLPRVPPRFSPGNALTIPREDVIIYASACSAHSRMRI